MIMVLKTRSTDKGKERKCFALGIAIGCLKQNSNNTYFQSTKISTFYTFNKDCNKIRKYIGGFIEEYM